MAASLIDSLLGLALASTGGEASNRFALEGLTMDAGDDGTRAIGIAKLEAASLRIASGPLVLEAGRVVLHGLAAQLRIEAGRARLLSLRAAGAGLSGLRIRGPLVLPHRAARGSAAGAWCLAPLAGANGTLRAEIVDAHLLFDADVTVPIRQGEVEFRDATVAHVGPDSRMGASRLGFYVDAPNGRSYLYQFASAPVAGVEYERRGALPGPWATDRGRLHLQAFAEWLLRQPWDESATGVTEQARLLFDRTAVAGEVRLGDGRFAAPGVQAELAGREQGRNAVRLHSEAVGRGLHVDMDALSLRNATWTRADARVACDGITGTLQLRLSAEDGPMGFTLDVAQLEMEGLRLDRGDAPPPSAQGVEHAEAGGVGQQRGH